MPELALPTVADYVAAILAEEGPFTVCGQYYGVADDAEVQRKRTAMRWVAEDRRRAERMQQQRPGIYAVAS